MTNRREKYAPEIYTWATSPHIPSSIAQTLVRLHDARIAERWLQGKDAPEGVPIGDRRSGGQALQNVIELYGDDPPQRGITIVSKIKGANDRGEFFFTTHRLEYLIEVLKENTAKVEARLGWRAWPWVKPDGSESRPETPNQIRVQLRGRNRKPTPFWVVTEPDAQRCTQSAVTVVKRDTAGNGTRDRLLAMRVVPELHDITDWLLETAYELGTITEKA